MKNYNEDLITKFFITSQAELLRGLRLSSATFVLVLCNFKSDSLKIDL